MSKEKSSENRGAMVSDQGKKDSKARAQTLAWIQAVREGSQESFSLLLERYAPLIEGAVSRFVSDGISELSREDLRQEAVLAFYSALVSYDLNISEVEFGLYAKVCICNRLVSQMRILKRHLSRQIISYDAEKLLERLVSYEDPAARIVELESERSLLRLINDNLSAYERRVFRMYVSGMSASDMAAKLDASEKSVNNAVYRIRKKLKTILKYNTDRS